MSQSTSTPLTIREPSGSAKGGVVVIQEAFGVNDHIVDVCERVAAAGWVAVAPHLYHRDGDPKFGYDNVPQVMPHMQALTIPGLLEDVDAALATIAAAGFAAKQAGIVGFCLGGSVSLLTAARRPIGAAVTFYGGGVTQARWELPVLVDEAPNLQAPWLGLYGDEDAGIPVEQVEELRTAAARSGQVTEIVRYPHAGHGFNCDQRDAFHPESAADAWARTLAWFDRWLTS